MVRNDYPEFVEVVLPQAQTTGNPLLDIFNKAYHLISTSTC